VNANQAMLVSTYSRPLVPRPTVDVPPHLTALSLWTEREPTVLGLAFSARHPLRCLILPSPQPRRIHRSDSSRRLPHPPPPRRRLPRCARQAAATPPSKGLGGGQRGEDDQQAARADLPLPADLRLPLVGRHSVQQSRVLLFPMRGLSVPLCLPCGRVAVKQGRIPCVVGGVGIKEDDTLPLQ
jgi:hypothetical protein